MKLCEPSSLRAGDPVVFSLKLEERDRICLRCPLERCVGVENPRYPVRVEQRRVWREKNKQRRSNQ